MLGGVRRGRARRPILNAPGQSKPLQGCRGAGILVCAWGFEFSRIGDLWEVLTTAQPVTI